MVVEVLAAVCVVVGACVVVFLVGFALGGRVEVYVG